LPFRQSQQIRPLLEYGEDTAGGIMTPVVVKVRDSATVDEAIHQLRNAAADEDFYAVYVVDDRERLVGLVPLRRLVVSPPDTPIRKIMQPDVISVRADEDQEEVVNLFRKYDLAAVPVVDGDGRLLGRVTVDDVIDALVEEADEDLFAMAGTEPEELDSTSVLRAARIRGTWLLFCLLGTVVSATIITVYQRRAGDAEHMLLLAFVPMIAAMAGNTGIQTSTVVVRGLAMGDLAGRSLPLAVARELRVGLLVALGCAFVGGLIAIIFASISIGHASGQPTHPLIVGVIVSLAMFWAVTAATVLGLTLPFVFRRIGVDPAIASGPFVTTGNDAISVAIYLSLAHALLG